MLGKPFLQTLTGLANVLFPTSGYPTADGIAQVGGGAVHLSGKVSPVVGGSGTEGQSRLNIWAGWSSGLGTSLHAWFGSAWSCSCDWWYFSPLLTLT